MTYGYCADYHLSIVTEPAIEPVTLDEALVQCHANQGVEDDWFYSKISACRRDAEKYMRRAFIEQTLRITFDAWPNLPILLPRAPLISVESFKLYDTEDAETTIGTSNLLVDNYSSPARLSINSGYSIPSVSLRELNSIIIEYKAGYGTTADVVPDEVKAAILLQLGYLYNCRSGEEQAPITEQWKCLLDRSKLYL